MEQTGAGRFAWIDIAKGICILLVVMMHSTLGVEKAVGAESGLHGFIAWAKPFRMPDFFFISGLFLAARINRPWLSYLDTKVVHFAYFYVLWVTIHIGLRAGGLIDEMGFAGALSFYLLSYVEPYGTLWFIYMLAIFFVVAKVAHGLPRVLVLAASTVLYLVVPDTGLLIVDEFANRFVFFYAGYCLAPQVFAYADKVDSMRWPVVAAVLAAWATVNAIGVSAGVTEVTGFDLLFGAAGVAAVITVSVLLRSTYVGEGLRYCGANSIAIYLSFTLFMAVTRTVLLKSPIAVPPEVVALACTFAGVTGALLMAWLVRGTRLGFLFSRPRMFRLQLQHVGGSTVTPTATA